MKIFYFPSFYPSDRPGEQWLGAFTHRQVKGLMEAGVEVEVVIPVHGYPVWPFYLLFPDWRRNHQHAHPSERTFEGVRISHPRVFSPKPNRFFKPYRHYYLKTATEFIKSRIEDKAETFLFAQWLPEAEMVVSVGKALDIKTAILGIGDDILKVPLQSPKHLAGFRYCWENADIRGVVADYLGKAANQIYGEDLPYEVFYSSVNSDEFFPVAPVTKNQLRSKYGIDEKKVVLLCVGSPIVRKGWLDLFDALSGIDFQNFLLLGVNGGAKELDLTNEARKRGLSDRFKDVGEVPSAQMNEYYQISDIFCLPSHWEGLANALLEAMSCSLPVVTTNVSGHPEVVQDGINGFMIEVGDTVALSNHLLQLMENETLRHQIGQSACDSIKKIPGTHFDTAKKIIEKFST